MKNKILLTTFLALWMIGIFSQNTTKNRFVGIDDTGLILFFDMNNEEFDTLASSASSGHALFLNPADNKLYAICDSNNTGSDRNLYEVNPFTGELSLISTLTGTYAHTGDLGDNGILYYVTGNGSSIPGQVYGLNLTSGVETLLYSTKANDGTNSRAMEYSPIDSSLYIYRGHDDSVFIYNLITSTEAGFLTSGFNDEVHGVFYDSSTNRMHLSFYRDDTIRSSDTSYRNYVGSPTQYLIGSIADNVMDMCYLQEKQLAMMGDSAFLCPGDSVLLSTIYRVPGTKWYKDSVVQTGSGNSYWATTSGTYFARIPIGNGSSDFQTEDFIVVNATSPVFSITQSANDSLICPGDTIELRGANGGTKQWYKNGIVIPGETGNFLNAVTIGSYNQTKTNMSGCYDSAQKAYAIHLDPNCGTSLPELPPNTFNLFPNPTVSDYVEVTSEDMRRIQIMNIKGQIILDEVVKNKEKTVLDISEFTRGVFLVKVIYIDGRFSIKKMIIS